MTFDEWTGGASEEEVEEMVAITKKRYHKFLLISLIPIVNWVTMGLAIFCYNNYSLLKSRGNSNGSNIWRFILMLYSLIIFPLIVVNICAHSDSLGTKVLGLN
ncbi:MAG: hypothetical protein NC131_14570 [Roseburia sp.]|nr:hypothetical protein [Roseburia sp.]